MMMRARFHIGGIIALENQSCSDGASLDVPKIEKDFWSVPRNVHYRGRVDSMAVDRKQDITAPKGCINHEAPLTLSIGDGATTEGADAYILDSLSFGVTENDRSGV